MQKSYKYRIYPNNSQIIKIEKTFGCVRLVWNKLTESFLSYDKEHNPNPTPKTINELKLEKPFLNEVSCATLQQKERDFIQFRRQYFSKSRKTKIARPNFKSKKNKQSFRLPNQKFKLLDGIIQLEKIGKVKIIIDRKPDEKCKFLNVTISKNFEGKYYASITVDEIITPKYIKTNKRVGIDLGIKTYITTSEGEEIQNPRWFRDNQAKLRKYQKRLARTSLKSNRRNKARIKVAKIYKKISNKRTWYIHQTVNSLLMKYDILYIEDLSVKNMLRNRKLSKSIHDASWSSFVSILEYKARWNDKQVIRIGRWFASSKLCTCGKINNNLTLKDRVWQCDYCGATHKRDILAANNILAEGERINGLSLNLSD